MFYSSHAPTTVCVVWLKKVVIQNFNKFAKIEHVLVEIVRKWEADVRQFLAASSTYLLHNYQM